MFKRYWWMLLVMVPVGAMAGFLIASVVTWFTASRDNRAYGERFGIFIGLWVPSFFILSNRLSRKADELPDVVKDEE